MDKKQKTKRSPNYTLEEKNNLLSIVSKYQNVIDCKRTGAYFVQQKKAAWKSVVMEYNSICTTGNRREDMLKHFYNNIKHRARKDSAIKNKKRYSEQLSLQTTNEDFFTQPSTSSQDEQTVVVEEANNESIIINENLLKDLKKKCADEQKNIKKTGGGSFTPTITESEYQILSVLDNQIHPDVNPYDEAAEYFGENVEENSKKEQVHKTSTQKNPYIGKRNKK